MKSTTPIDATTSKWIVNNIFATEADPRVYLALARCRQE